MTATSAETTAIEILSSSPSNNASQNKENNNDIDEDYGDVVDNDFWEELPSFNDLRSKMEEHHLTLKKYQNSCRTKVQDNVDSIWLQTFIVLLVIFDLIIGLTTIISDPFLERIITLIIIIIYCIEICFRIYAYGFKKYFTSILDIIDFIAVLGSLILYIFAIYIVYTLLVKILRWIRVIRTTYRAVFSRTKKIQKAIRHLQRSNLIGYRDEKYDLDIAYITDHILIMSRPATKTINQFSHDSLNDIKAFLDEKHKNSYKIYDLCVYDDIKSEENEQQQQQNDISSVSPAISESNISQSSALSLFPVNIDISDGPNTEYDTFGLNVIINNFSFRGSTVLSLSKLFEFAEHATNFADEKSSNVIIIQSTSGLGRAMFICTCLLFYYYPTAALSDILHFVHKERIDDENEKKEDLNNDGVINDLDLFCKFLPSQTRYIQYFATLISHCYKLAHANDEIDKDIQSLERTLSQRMEIMHENNNNNNNNNKHHQQQSTLGNMLTDDVISAFNKIEKSKWNFYHKYAEKMLNSSIGIVIKYIAIYNYFDEIDPYINWEADIFQWKEEINKNKNNNNNYKCIEYDTFKYGIDSEPGKNSSLIKRDKNIKPMVIEKDFGIRIYKSIGNRDDERIKNRKLMAQLILHSHFINLDKDQLITFDKTEIDFVNKDRNNKFFPKDFHIVIRAKILRKKM